MVAIGSQPSYWEVLDRYSSFIKLLRVTALCRRFVSSAKNTAFITNATSIDTQLELEQSRKFWIRMVQQAYFSYEIRLISRTEQLPKSNP